MTKIVLRPRESMKRRRAQERLAVDADNVHRVIRNNPGIPSKAAIASQTGLSIGRVAMVLQRINAEETGHARVEFGELKPRGGPYAGQTIRGWYAMNIKHHHDAMDQADERSASIEVGVRRARLMRYEQAQGIRGAEPVVAEIEERLGLSDEALAERDVAAFEQLLLDEAA